MSKIILKNIIRYFLNEGGNVTATSFETGDIIQRNTPDGGAEPRTAQRIPLKDIGRDSLIKLLNEMFEALQAKFSDMHSGDELWPGGYKPTKYLFSGSSSTLYDANVCTDEFCDVKPTLGDIDIMIPHDKLQKMWEVLYYYQKSGKEIIKNVKFIGCSSVAAKGVGDLDQLNCTFEYTMKSGETIDMQVDFERARFSDEKDGQIIPDWFSSFAHSSTWSDVKLGIKGFAHKLLLQSIYVSLSKRQGKVVTKASGFDNPKIQTSVDRTTGERRQRENPNEYGMSFTHGLRKKIKDFGIHPEHGQLWKELPAPTEIKKINAKIKKNNEKNGTNIPLLPDALYEKEYNKLFLSAFPSLEPTDENKIKFSSFVGLVELINEEYNESVKLKIFKSFASRIVGGRSQILYINNPDLELKEKAAPLVYMIKNLGLGDEAITYMNEKMEKHKIRVYAQSGRN